MCKKTLSTETGLALLFLGLVMIAFLIDAFLLEHKMEHLWPIFGVIGILCLYILGNLKLHHLKKNDQTEKIKHKTKKE